MTTPGPVAKLLVLPKSAPANPVGAPVLLVAVRAKILRQDRWKARLIRMLAHLMPGLKDMHVSAEHDNEFQLAFTHPEPAVITLWQMATATGMNACIARIPKEFEVGGYVPTPEHPMVQWIWCASRVTEYDLQALLSAPCVAHAVIADDPAYNGTAIRAYLNDPSTGSGNAGKRGREIKDALAFVPFT